MKKLLSFFTIVFFSGNLMAQTALFFDGADDQVIITGNSKLNGLARLTLETWIYTDFKSSPCLDCAPIIWNQAKGYRFGTGSTKIVAFALQNGTAIVSLNSTTTLNANTWHHIAGTFDGTKMRIYIDGVATDSLASAFAITYSSSTADVWIVDPVTGYGGILEQTRIWDYARSKKEIQEGMIRKYPTGTKGLVLQFGYEDGTAYLNNTSVTNLADNSSNSNNGTLANFKLSDTVSNFVLGRTYCDTAIYSNFSVSQCVKYTVPSQKRTVTVSGTYNDTIVSYQGCDSIMTIKVTILSPNTGTATLAGCDSIRNPYTGTIYKKSTKFNATIKNKAGCDSVITYTVTIYKKDSTVNNYNTCDFALLKNGKKVFTGGRYVDSFKNIRGCDSIVVHNVKIRKMSTAQKNLKVCLFVLCPSNFSKVFYTPGIYYDTLPNKVGCDSIITYNVLSALSYNTLIVKTCLPYKSPSKKYTYTQSGIYSDTLFQSNKIGCDSIITINLTMDMPTKQNLKITECKSYLVPSGKRWITSTQIVTDIIKSKKGCDSIEYTIDVTINKPNTTITRSGNVLTAATTNGSAFFQWLNCDANYSMISGATNKQYSPGKNGNFAVEVKEDNCNDTSACVAFVLAGVKDVLTQQIVISSNPSNGSFAISCANTLHNAKVTLYDIKGGLIQSWEMAGLDEQQFHVETAAGLYYLKIEASEGFKVLPLMFK